MAIVKLNYNGTEIPLSVGYYALKRYKMDTGREFTDIDDDIETLEVLFWYALEAGYKHEQKDNPFKREDAEIILDSVMMDFVARIPDFFPQSPTEISVQETTKPKPKNLNSGGRKSSARK